MKRIVIGNDHGAVDLKYRIIEHLEKRGYAVTNMGIEAEDAADYPDMGEITCREFLKGGYEFGVVACGTGIGISMAANKVDGIRCALIHNKFTAEMAKNHNNANILAFGGRIDYVDSIEDMLDVFIDTKFGDPDPERHARRVQKIMDLEKK